MTRLPCSAAISACCGPRLPDSLTLRPAGLHDQALDPAAVRLAVVIPAYNQPGLLPEALASVLAQEGAPPIAAVVVDDGCPSPATARIARQYAAAHPGRVYLLRQRNQGLSAARNTGIGFVLRAFPACRAIFFLDADNRLLPRHLARGWAALQAAPPETGWFYPDINELGGTGNGSTEGEFSLLHLLVLNYCEAGSLVRREVFEAGLRFDTVGMRAGFEDWDFWLQAARAGFRGRHLADWGFLYRKRPESMLSAAERQRDQLIRVIRDRHAPLLRPRALMALEAAEAPRFALFEPDAAGVALCLDPAERRVLPAEAFRRRLLQARLTPGAVHVPALCLFAEAPALGRLRERGLLPGLLWWAERLLRDAELVPFRLGQADGPELAFDAWQPATRGCAEAALLLLRTDRLLAFAEATDPAALASLDTAAPEPRLAPVSIRLPEPPPAGGGMPLRLLQAEVAALARLREEQAGLPKPWRADWRLARSTMAAEARAGLGIGATPPLPPAPGKRDIAFILPLFAFAGLEKVAMCHARVLRARGWRTHLVVAGALRMEWGPEVAAAFDTVTLFAGLGEERVEYEGGYFGSAVSGMQYEAGAEDALGLLAQCHAVLNIHAVGCHALAGRLRRLGVRCFGMLHLLERQSWDEPKGNTHVMAAYEHVYDGILVISDQLRRWCIGNGVPRDKLLMVRNAPGHDSPPTRVAAALAERRSREGPLRVLSLGRLDLQKGTDRLAAIMPATRGPEVAWRVVGRPVPIDGTQPLLEVPAEPPVQAPEALDALYAWADVLVLPSRFEGVPLVVLEAQRIGCVVIATDVGAVPEIVADGEDGILVPAGLAEEAMILRFTDAIRRLAADRAALRALGERAAARAGALSWDGSMHEFLLRLDALVPPAAPAPLPQPGATVAA